MKLPSRSLILTRGLFSVAAISLVAFSVGPLEGSLFTLISLVILIGLVCSSGTKTATIASTAKTASREDDSIEEYVPEVEEPRAELKELPIETIEGIGTKYGAMLRASGIETVADLVASKPDQIADICHVNIAVASRWHAMSKFCWLETVSEEDAEAIVYAGGIMDLEELAEANAKDLLDDILESVELGHVQIPEGYKFDLDMVKRWIEEAKRRITYG